MAWLERCWYRACLVRFLLAPLSLLFFLLSGLRRLAYARGWLRVERLPVPVVVVGNISVGGTGKTPLVIWLVEQLRQAGWHPAVISRGYAGRAHDMTPVRADSDPRLVGDEPVLLARRAACPVWVGRHRAAVARQLLAFHPEVDVLISDDGLQHYALGRDVEIAVVDAARGFGNGWLLPAGPLREPVGRLAGVDAVVVNGGGSVPGMVGTSFTMRLVGSRFRSLSRPERAVGAAYFSGKQVHAVAGIGNPQRFFDHLESLGVIAMPRPLPDHHAYRPEDLPAGVVLMTEKDAVKCADFGLTDAWVLQVDAELPPGLKDRILENIGHRHGPEAA